ncbi:hypothetical protein FRC07_007280, partial [Ceratobasidium sp. 392]
SCDQPSDGSIDELELLSANQSDVSVINAIPEDEVEENQINTSAGSIFKNQILFHKENAKKILAVLPRFNGGGFLKNQDPTLRGERKENPSRLTRIG